MKCKACERRALIESVREEQVTDDDLVESLLSVGQCHGMDIIELAGSPHLKKLRLEAEAEIRELLQRQRKLRLNIKPTKFTNDIAEIDGRYWAMNGEGIEISAEELKKQIEEYIFKHVEYTLYL